VARRDTAGDNVVEAGLVNGNLARLQKCHTSGIHVKAHNVMTQIGEAGAGYQPNVARSDNGDAVTHMIPLRRGGEKKEFSEVA
jgi:hypothetical protein